MKKIFFMLILPLILFLSNVFAQQGSTNPDPFGTRTDFNPNIPGAQGLQWEGLLTSIQKGINWILWILAFIALIVLLWWWFQMVTAAGNEEKYKKWFTILKQSAIWLLFIGLAWLIVSLIFAVIWAITS